MKQALTSDPLALPGPAVVAALIAVGTLLGPGDSRAQGVPRVVGEPILLFQNDDAYFMQPRWSPDGSRIAFTSESYRGIWILRISDGSVVQLSNERAAGFGFSWSPDGRYIAARVARFDGPRRSDAVKLFVPETGGEQLLLEYQPVPPGLPTWSRDAAHVVVEAGARLEVLAVRPTSGKSESSEPVLLVRDHRVAVARPSLASLTDIWRSDSQPLNLVQSPDGTSAAFEVVGGNLYVISVDGSRVVDLGSGHRPQWSPDSEWLVFMRTEDDGHVFASSDLFAASADGSEVIRLTSTPEALEMNPSWSADGTRIAYDDRGALFQLSLSH